MRVVAGPAGAGKSTAFPVAEMGVDSFNVDDHCAQLNGGSYRNIPPSIREQANRALEQFIESHIRTRRSFAVETTLRSPIVFEQAHSARERGFQLDLKYLALDDVEAHIERMAIRADAGGHSAPAGRLREIHRASLANLVRVLQEFDRVRVYDNSTPTGPRLLLTTRNGHVIFVARDLPRWIHAALRGTEYEPHLPGDL